MLKPYDPGASCPKCGETEIETFYHPPHAPTKRCRAGMVTGEHLCRKCSNCGVRWTEATIERRPSFAERIGQPELQAAQPRAIPIPGVSVPPQAMHVPGGPYPRGWTPPSSAPYPCSHPSAARTLPQPMVYGMGGKPEKRKMKDYTQEVIDKQNEKFLEKLAKRAKKKGKPGRKPKRHYTRKPVKKDDFPPVDEEAVSGPPMGIPEPSKNPVQPPPAPSSPADISRAVDLLRKKGAKP